MGPISFPNKLENLGGVVLSEPDDPPLGCEWMEGKGRKQRTKETHLFDFFGQKNNNKVQ